MPKTRTSFKKGNKAHEGYDKTLSLSNWLDRELKRELEDSDDYGERMTVAKQIARDVISTLRTTENADTKLAYFKEIADRTEGKSKQSTEITGGDGGPLKFEIVTYAEGTDTD